MQAGLLEWATMRRTISRHGRRFHVWMAIWAILLAALVPTVSHLLQSGARWVEVCQSPNVQGVGIKWMQVDEAGKPLSDSVPSAHLLDHCPYCALQAFGLALPVLLLALALLALTFAPPPQGTVVWRSLLARHLTRSRGPPLFV